MTLHPSLDAIMPKANVDAARNGPAPLVTRCIVVGEGENVRLAFLDGDEDGAPASLLSAVILTRAQLTGFAGMVGAILDTDDPDAVSVN